MRMKLGLLTAALSAMAVVTTATLPATAQTYFPTNVDKSKCSLSASEFNEDWTKLDLELFKLPGKLGPVYDASSGMVYVFPTNGPEFSKDTTDHCDFYKWGAQMFLWLTSTINDKTIQTHDPKFPVGLPYVFNSEFFYRLSADHTQLLAQGSGVTSPNMAVSLRTKKTDDDDDSVGQAGEKSGVLLTQGETPSLTYYAVHTNRLYGYFLKRYKETLSQVFDAGQFPTTADEACETIHFAKEKHLIERGSVPDFIEHALCPKAFKNILDNSKTKEISLTIPEIEPAVDYLSLAAEVKTSWVDTATLPADKLHKYIVQNQEIPVYDKSNPKRWVRTGSETKELAMVGMHVVGSVEDHPEMIWATIEHEDNAPNSVYYYTDSSKKVVEVTGPQKDSKWTFSNGTISDSVLEPALSCDKKTMAKGCVQKTDIVLNPTSGTSIQASNVTRLHPWGNVQSKSDMDAISQNTQIISLNNDVRALVNTNNAKDPRQYYFLSGAIWTSDGSIPINGNYGKNTGSTILANTTMETFQQKTSCFGCHYSSSASDGLGISHIFDGISPDLPKAPDH